MSECYCRPGYKCPSCEREEQRAERHDAEKRRVENLLKEDDDD